jgi:hypothetical protein
MRLHSLDQNALGGEAQIFEREAWKMREQARDAGMVCFLEIVRTGEQSAEPSACAGGEVTPLRWRSRARRKQASSHSSPGSSRRRSRSRRLPPTCPYRRSARNAICPSLGPKTAATLARRTAGRGAEDLKKGNRINL